jgi:thiamine biosynthesis protein ThiI
MKLLIRYFPEIMLKSRSVHRHMTVQLQRNLRTQFKRLTAEVKIRRGWDRMEIECDDAIAAEVCEVLNNTSGIDQFLRVDSFLLADLAGLITASGELFSSAVTGKTFAVRCKRTGRHPFNSMDVERGIGAWLIHHAHSRGVDLQQPEVTLQIEIRDDRFHVVHTRTQGLGGFPLGTVGNCLSLLSGGFDSAVASHLAIRRGLFTHFLFFNLGGELHERSVMRVAQDLWERYESSHPACFISVPFAEVMLQLSQTVEGGYGNIILKRLMLRAADHFCSRLKLEAVLTGESIAQVSSQTVRNLSLIDAVSSRMVMRPLLMMHKQEILDMARTTGLWEKCQLIPEYCGACFPRPQTHGNFKRLEEEENKLDMSVFNRALENATVRMMNELPTETLETTHVEEINDAAAGEYTVIDIRWPERLRENPLLLRGARQLHIPFLELDKRFSELDQSRQYLLYCDHGEMSRAHAHFLRQAGYNNVNVYRPEQKSKEL